MGKILSVFLTVIILMINVALFYYVPNGLLITFAMFPYLIWWITFKEKTPMVAIPILLFLFIFMFIVVPVAFTFNQDIIFFQNMYDIIYPGGFSYTWSQQVPEFMVYSMTITVSLILFTKMIIWILKHISRSFSKKNIALGYSRLLFYVGLIYTILGLLPALLGEDVLIWFRDFFVTSIFYDIFFIWMPFVALFFLFDYIQSALRGKT
jgi:hypothetical protein